jgi:hypothetical protein
MASKRNFVLTLIGTFDSLNLNGPFLSIYGFLMPPARDRARHIPISQN